MEDGPLTSIAQGFSQGRQAWRQLDAVEQNLRRASHGFALILFTLAAVVFVYGWRGVLNFFPWFIADPAHAWPAAAVVGALLAYGLVRFLVGVRRLAGMRDGLRASGALVRLALGLAVTIFLGRLYPWPGATGWAALAVPAVFLIGLGYAVNGAVRLVVLSVPRGTAGALAAKDARAEKFRWDRPPRW